MLIWTGEFFQPKDNMLEGLEVRNLAQRRSLTASPVQPGESVARGIARLEGVLKRMDPTSLLGTMHLLLLLQPEVNPQRCPEGHCEFEVQVTPVSEPCDRNADPSSELRQSVRTSLCSNNPHPLVSKRSSRGRLKRFLLDLG